jgi:predicted ATP-dependent endonuclease of OLD family
LDYEPVLKLEYKIHSRVFEYFERRAQPPDLFNFLDDNNDANRFRRYSKDKYKEIVSNKHDELIEFINSYHSGEKEILINFSEKNISRISNDKSGYYDNVQSYNILGILRKLDLIRNIEIKVYKKGGLEFNFSDASSGEANILSTLIALIPLIQNNSLILIDEPEISLHPLWQSRYISLINKIFSNFHGCHIIIASHSHFLVTELHPKNSSVITLQNKKGLIVSEVIKESTFGWSVEDILLNVFGLPTTRNYYLSLYLSKALELLSDHKRSDNELNDLINKIKNYYPLLKESDPLKKVAKIILEYKYER